MTLRRESTEALRRDGFTLIELLIVVVILGILATITIPKFTASRERAYRAAVIADLRALSSSQELYFTRNHTYTDDLVALDAVDSPDVSITVNEATNGGWAATAVHAGVTGTAHCGIYYGDAVATGGTPASSAGIVECTF